MEVGMELMGGGINRTYGHHGGEDDCRSDGQEDGPLGLVRLQKMEFFHFANVQIFFDISRAPEFFYETQRHACGHKVDAGLNPEQEVFAAYFGEGGPHGSYLDEALHPGG